MLYLGMDLIIIGYPVRDRLIFIMGIPIPWKTVFIQTCIEMASGGDGPAK